MRRRRRRRMTGTMVGLMAQAFCMALLPLLMAMMKTIAVEVMAKKMVMPTTDGTTLLRPGV